MDKSGHFFEKSTPICSYDRPDADGVSVQVLILMALEAQIVHGARKGEL